MSKSNNSGKLRRYYNKNIAKIFLCGILFSTIFIAIHVVVGALDSQRFAMKYSASISSTYASSLGGEGITAKECKDIVSSEAFAEDIKYYLGSYVTYEEFLNSISFEVKKNDILVYYIDESQIRAKRMVNTVSRKLNNYLLDKERVEYIQRNGNTTLDETKVQEPPRIKIGMLYFAEIGMVAGCLFGCVMLFVVYFANGRIKTKSDVEDKLHIAVLTEIQYIEDLAK